MINPTNKNPPFFQTRFSYRKNSKFDSRQKTRRQTFQKMPTPSPLPPPRAAEAATATAAVQLVNLQLGAWEKEREFGWWGCHFDMIGTQSRHYVISSSWNCFVAVDKPRRCSDVRSMGCKPLFIKKKKKKMKF